MENSTQNFHLMWSDGKCYREKKKRNFKATQFEILGEMVIVKCFGQKGTSITELKIIFTCLTINGFLAHIFGPTARTKSERTTNRFFFIENAMKFRIMFEVGTFCFDLQQLKTQFHGHDHDNRAVTSIKRLRSLWNLIINILQLASFR